jgi:hypothetical protein
MGRKDRRSVSLNSNVSPKTTPSKHIRAKSEDETSNTSGVQENSVVSVQDGAEAEDRPTMTLPFRSYMSGTLLTENFQPSTSTAGGLEPFPPSQPDQKPNPTAKAFVPRSHAGFHATRTSSSRHSHQSSSASSQDSPGLSKLQELIASFPPPPGTPQSHRTVRSAFTTPVKDSPYTTVSTPSSTGRNSSPVPAKAVRTFLARADRSKKDIVVSSLGIIHNIERITEGYLPSGHPYRTSSEESNPENYDFLKALQKMGEEERKAFWENNWVEIIVDFCEISEPAGSKYGAGTKKIAVGKDVPGAEEDFITGEGVGTKGVAGSNEDDANEANDVKEGKKKEIEKPNINIVEMLGKLGADCFEYTTSIVLTIKYPVTPALAESSKKVVSCTKAQQETACYKLMEKLVEVLEKFSAMKRMEVVMRTPSETRTPISLEQLNYLLPLYDLAFTNWEIRWQADFMSRSEPVRGWPITYMDKEASKILYQRELEQKRLETLVFKHPGKAGSPRDLPLGQRPLPRC